MNALLGGRRGTWARGRFFAAFSLLGIAEVGISIAMPLSAGAYQTDPTSNGAGAVASGPSVLLGPVVPSPSVPALPLPTLPAPSIPTISPPAPPSPTPPVLVTPLPTPPVLATPTALPTPPVLATPTPLPTPTLPVVLGTPTPSLPALGGPAPSPTTIAAAPGGSAGRPGSGAGGGAPSGGAPGGIHLPLMGVVLSTPLDVALLAVLAGLPLLVGIWVLVFGRTWSEARQARRAQIRLAVANELGLRPRELISVSTEALFKLREEAAFDELTGTLRRAAGMAALDREISRARRVKAPLSVVFIDLDGLKQANDKRGHKAGDELLRGLAALLKSGLRGQDLVTRYGGDEFVCVLPDTPAEAARAKLTSIQAEAGRMEIRFSAGVAELERPDDVVSLLARADGEMYNAKARRGEVRQLRPDPGPSGTVLRPDVRT